MSKKTGIVKLAKLRELLEAAPIPGTTKKGIQAVIINSCDAHQSEYICPQDERRAYISGFKGTYVVLTEHRQFFKKINFSFTDF